MKKQFRCSSDATRRVAGILAFAALIGSACAEFEVGAEIPSFSLKTPEGELVELGRRNGKLTVEIGERRMDPKALIVHLLQPDCLQCQAQLEGLKPLAERFDERGILTLGIAHRGGPEAVRALAEEFDLPFPILMGAGAEISKRFAAGDTLGIADAEGVVRYAQVGYGSGDQKLWEQALEELLAGEQITKTGVDRERLAVGDLMPAIKLPSLRSGEPLAMVGKGGDLVFRDDEDNETKPKAAVGFFSRYWAFSREEMVHLQKFHEEYAEEGLQVFVIAMHSDPEEARKLTRELGVTFPVFDGRGSDLGEQYAFGWPAYIIDAGGVIRYTQVGFEEGDQKKYEEVIKKLLKSGE